MKKNRFNFFPLDIIFYKIRYMSVLFFLIICIQTISTAKTNKLPPSITLRPIPVKNVEYSRDGKLLAVPNLITAGSVGVFSVSEKSEITRLPLRYSEKNFYRVAGVFYFSTQKKEDPQLVFLSLPELLSGYSVAFSPNSDALAVAGGEKVYMYSTADWKLIRTITVSVNTTRVVFSPDNAKMAVIADGAIYIFYTDSYSVRATIQPQTNHKFADITFSKDSKIIAALEYRDILLDYNVRVRLYDSQNGDIDRSLPYFPDRLSSPPGNHFPLISFAPQDTAFIVSLERSFGAKTLLIKSNDGTLLTEFKGAHHAFSPDMTTIAIGGKIFTVDNWKTIGKYNRMTLCCSFSPTDRTIAAIIGDKMERYKIEW